MTSEPDGMSKDGIGPATVNGDGEAHPPDAPRPSVTAMLGSLLGAVEKDTAENMARREAEAQARARAIVVHSPHVLMEFEKDAARQIGRDPTGFVAVTLAGQTQMQNLPNGEHVLILALPIPRDFFTALDVRAVVDANGNAQSAKFNRQLLLPITARVVLEKEGLGAVNGLHDNAILLQEYEGRTYGELLDAGYVPPPGQPLPRGM